MSEYVPVAMPEARTEAAVSGWRELLELNLGRRITAEFYPGRAEAVVKTGMLYAVQPEYFLLTDDYGNYVAGGFDSLRFVTFCPNCVPADSTPQPRDVQPPTGESDTHTEAAELLQPQTGPRGGSTVSAAALNYAKRKARRLD